MASKPPYHPTRRCRLHADEVAAVCSTCYDEALEQQAQQRRIEQKREHERYLERVSG